MTVGDLALALILAAAPRTFDWAAAVGEFPALAEYVPAASDAQAREFVFVKLGAKCVRAAEKMTLDEGARNNHTWHWTMSVRFGGGAVTIDGPAVTHGFDRPGDTRTFKASHHPVKY